VNGLEIAGRQIKVGLVNESNMIPGATGGGGVLGELDDDGMNEWESEWEREGEREREGRGGEGERRERKSACVSIERKVMKFRVTTIRFSIYLRTIY
jgi:hypothetical protein